MAQGYIRPNAGTDQCRLATLPSTSVGFTICGWVRRKSILTGAFQPVIWTRFGGGSGFVFLGWDNTDDFVLFSNIWDTGSASFTFTKPADDEWFFVSFSWKNSDVAHGRWWDSTFTLGDHESSATSSLGTADYVEALTEQEFSEYSDALGSQFRVFDSVLTQTELETEMVSPVPVHASCVSAWEDDPTTDVSGNANPWSNVSLLSGSDDWPPNYGADTSDTSVDTSDTSAVPAVSITHAFYSMVPDGPDTGLVRPSNWNDEHVVTGIEPDLGVPAADAFLASDAAGARSWRQPAGGAPASAGSPGSPGQVAFDSGHVYVCVAVDTWKRVTVATW